MSDEVEHEESRPFILLQERMVALVNQLDMPVMEVALVVKKFIRILITRLESIAEGEGGNLPPNVTEAWPIETTTSIEESGIDLSLDRLLNAVDTQRMDILDTLIRTVINDEQIPLLDAILILRQWEHLIRSQLATVEHPRELYYPLALPEGF